MIDILNKNNVNIAKKSEAFTLAEVLITLTIIGVIAAITIPNLIQSYKKHQIETGLREAYSIIQNAFRMSMAENGPTDSWNGTLYSYFEPYLKIQSDCGIIGNYEGKSKSCFKYMPNVGYGCGTWLDLKGQYVSLGGSGSCWYRQVKLQNGMDIAFGGGVGSYPVIVVDVNGANNGPTMLGADVFAFQVVKDKNKIQTYNNGTNKIQNILNDTSPLGGCNDRNDWSGYACSRAIELSGWKIPDDYPVKKF